jgi:hypothetical protein
VKGRCLICSWWSKLVEHRSAREGICWWCAEDGWRAVKPAPPPDEVLL